MRQTMASKQSLLAPSAHHLGNGALCEEAAKQQRDAILDLAVGVFDHDAVGPAYQTDRKR